MRFSARLHAGSFTSVFFPFFALIFLVPFIVFIAACGGGGSGGGGASNAAAPTAHAQADQTVPVGTLVTVDGSSSDSPSGAPLTYQWALTQKPSGSITSLSNPTSVRSSFTPDVAGTYTLTLVVHANGVASQPDAVSITAMTGNVAPVADAGPARSAPPDQPMTLDGTASHDPNNTQVTYSWRIVKQPPGSNPVLTNANTATPTLTADVPGVYTLELIVSDGSMTSPPVQTQCTVGTGNLPPVANAGPDQTVTVGQLVTLSGAGSRDPNGDPLTYSWCVRGKPDGSTATLTGANTVSPTFTPDIAGSYVLCLTVSDGQASSTDTVVVEAKPSGIANGVLQAYIKSSNPRGGQHPPGIIGGDEFGLSTALSGDTLVVGAPNEASCATGINGDQTNNPNNGCTFSGAVYVFTRANGIWSQQAYIKASNTQAPDFFGLHVALSGDTLAVSAPNEASCATGINGDQTNNDCLNAGAVYVFTRTNGVWSQQAYLKASNTAVATHLGFGSSLALEGDTLAVGMVVDSSCAICSINDGSTVVFTRTNGVWAQQAVITPPSTVITTGDYAFGVSVSVNGDTLTVGASGDSSCGTGVNSSPGTTVCTHTGAVYVFLRNNGAWTQEAFIKASNPDINDFFGSYVTLSGDTLAVGARSEGSCATDINGDQTNNGCPLSGAAYVFTRSNGIWSQQAYVKASNTNAGDSFGSNIGLVGDTLTVGAPLEGGCATGLNGNRADNSCPGAGAIYVYTRSAGVWSPQTYMKASNSDQDDRFGSSVALTNSTLAIGAPGESSCASGINGNQRDNNCFQAGAVYVYVGQ